MPSDDVIATLARYDVVYLWQFTDARYTAGVLDLSWADAIAARVRAVNPEARIGLYGGPFALVTAIDPGYAWFSDAELFHAPNGAPLIYTHPDQAHPQKVFRFPNLLDPVLRTKLVTGWCDLMEAHNFDCLMLDAFSPGYYAQLIREAPEHGGYFGLAGGIEQGWRMDTEDWWRVVLTALGAQLRWELGQRGKSVMAVGLWPYPYDPENPAHVWRGIGESNIVDHAGGAISEHCVEGHGNPALFRDILDTLKRAVDKRRDVFVYALPWMLDQQYPTRDSLEFQRWCLAMYLLIQEVSGSSFGYSDVLPFRGWAGADADGPGEPYVFWSEDWERDYGRPLDRYVSDPADGSPPKLVWRTYTRGRSNADLMQVVVNPTTMPQAWNGPVGTWRVWDEEAGPIVNATPTTPLTVPARTGWVLWAV